MSDRLYDVLVVGAGPAGSSCASVLAQSGANVLLVDKARFPREKICGDCINPGCWQHFHNLGISEDLTRRKLNLIREVRVTNRNGRTLTVTIPVREGEPFFAVRRSELDLLLLENAQKHGVQVTLGQRVVQASWSGRWNVSTQSDDGIAGSRHSSRFLIGADGRNSIVARLLKGNGFHHKGKGEHPRVAVQWRCSYQPEIEGAVELILLESGYCGVVNIDRDCANLAMVILAAVACAADQDQDQLFDLTLGRTAIPKSRLPSLLPIGRSATAFPVNPFIRRIQHPYAFLAGDAHRSVEPFTGEGVFFALEDGEEIALQILQRLQSLTTDQAKKRRSSFTLNHLFSPALRRPRLSDFLFTVAVRYPSLASLAAGTVFR